jgi:hypothetical protein
MIAVTLVTIERGLRQCKVACFWRIVMTRGGIC